MARVTVTAFTAARMLQIESSTIVSGQITNGILYLIAKDGTRITAGSAAGPKGDRGEAGGIWDAEANLKGAVRLAGNLGGTADAPKVVGQLAADVDLSLAKISASFTHPFTNETSVIEASARETLVDARTAALRSAAAVTARGRAKVIWSGSEAEYTALPAAEKNDPGFIGVII